jgi:hypothetical protein
MYLERGGEPGGELDDWLRAEDESNKTLSLSGAGVAGVSRVLTTAAVRVKIAVTVRYE